MELIEQEARRQLEAERQQAIEQEAKRQQAIEQAEACGWELVVEEEGWYVSFFDRATYLRLDFESEGQWLLWNASEDPGDEDGIEWSVDLPFPVPAGWARGVLQANRDAYDWSREEWGDAWVAEDRVIGQVAEELMASLEMSPALMAAVEMRLPMDPDIDRLADLHNVAAAEVIMETARRLYGMAEEQKREAMGG